MLGESAVASAFGLLSTFFVPAGFASLFSVAATGVSVARAIGVSAATVTLLDNVVFDAVRLDVRLVERVWLELVAVTV